MSLRILVAGQPKAGNVWVRKILSELYALHDLNEVVSDIPASAPAFAAFVKQGRFLDDAVLQQHLWPNEHVLGTSLEIGCHIVTPIRNPYDSFVSYYHFVNGNAEHFRQTAANALINKPLHHPDVAHFAATKYRGHLRCAYLWKRSGRALIVRYEDLRTKPALAMRRLVESLAPRTDSEIELALEACSPDMLRRKGGWLTTHVRSASIGEGKATLSPTLLQAFRKCHPGLIRALGYDVL